MDSTPLITEGAVSTLKRSDCISLKKSEQQLGITRTTLNAYVNALGVPKHKFPLDSNVYITKVDFERIREYKAESEQE